MQLPSFKVGNIRENDLSEIYKTDTMETVLELTVETSEECKGCDIRYYCGGGCRGFACAVGGSCHGPDPLDCESNKIVARKILENGEESTKRNMIELLQSTRELDSRPLDAASHE